MGPKEIIKQYLYKPQPLNYKRASGNERIFYEWLLKHEIVTEVYYNKDTYLHRIKYRLWGKRN